MLVSQIQESIMTYNPYGLKIEINMSNGTKYVDNIMSHRPNRENLIGCHNFYPHRYSGLSYDHFIKCSKQFKDYGMRTAGFYFIIRCNIWTLASNRRVMYARSSIGITDDNTGEAFCLQQN